MTNALHQPGARVEPGVYHIAFNTTATPGFLRALKVTIELDMLPDDAGMPAAEQERYNVALADHPLYAELRRYCIANPGPQRSKGSK